MTGAASVRLDPPSAMADTLDMEATEGLYLSHCYILCSHFEEERSVRKLVILGFLFQILLVDYRVGI